MWSVFKIAARAAIWRATRDPRLVGLPTLIGWILVLAAVRCALQFAEALPTPGFNPYGLNAVVAWLAIALVVTACFVPPPARVTALSAMVVLSVLTEIVLGTIKFAAPLIQSWIQTLAAVLASLGRVCGVVSALHALWTGFGAPVAMFLAPAVSWTGAMFAILRSFEAGAPVRVLGKVIALWAALFVAKSALPHAPVFAGSEFRCTQRQSLGIRPGAAFAHVR